MSIICTSKPSPLNADIRSLITPTGHAGGGGRDGGGPKGGEVGSGGDDGDGDVGGGSCGSGGGDDGYGGGNDGSSGEENGGSKDTVYNGARGLLERFLFNN